MSGISKNIVNSVNRLKSTFIDDLGNHRTIQGTGFWLTLPKGGSAFITNKHNVDLKIKLGIDTKFSLSETKIEIRKLGDNLLHNTTEFFLIKNLTESLNVSSAADCALFRDPIFPDKPKDFKSIPLRYNEIADEQFLKEKVQIMDFASFIGFPGDSQTEWWDQYFNFPIARLCSISSLPEIPFRNKAISTEDVTLVAGFSFSGSSGSPVILHEKSIKVDEKTLTNPFYVPPRIIGIMSGHTIEFPNNESMFRHTGLSYFTRSTSILNLIDTLK
jgi:hypothetical protein